MIGQQIAILSPDWSKHCNVLQYWVLIRPNTAIQYLILTCDWSTHCQVLPLYQRIAQDRDLFRRVVAENIGTEGEGGI